MTYCNLTVRGKKHVLWFDNEDQAISWIARNGFRRTWLNVAWMTADGSSTAHIFTPNCENAPSAVSQVEKELAQ